MAQLMQKLEWSWCASGGKGTPTLELDKSWNAGGGEAKPTLELARSWSVYSKGNADAGVGAELECWS